MRRLGLIGAAAAAALALGAPGARAQSVLGLEEPGAVFTDFRLGVNQVAEEIVTKTHPIDFIREMRGRRWDMIYVLHYHPIDAIYQADVLEELRKHLDAGGTLSVTYTPLDEWPEFQALLGVASAVDPAAPEFIFPTDPRHPTWLETPFLAVDPPTWWPDFGDVLTPAPGGRAIGEYELSGDPAMLETRNGAVLVNGLDWDDAGAAAVLMGRDQTYYLTGCLPDFDDNGSLDLFDFLAYQNAFAMGDRRADLNKDGFLSLFDFLIFQNAFELGCRPQ